MAVLDVDDEAWPPPNLEQVQAWLRAEGIDPNITTRVEVRPSAPGLVATLHQNLLNADGKSYCPLKHAHDPMHPDGCEIASIVREVRVSSLPPEPDADTEPARELRIGGVAFTADWSPAVPEQQP